MQKYLSLFLILFFIPAPALAKNKCLPPPGLVILREFEHGNKRVLYIKVNPADINNLSQVKTTLRKVKTFVKKCRRHWRNKWDVVFTTDKKYAYKKKEKPAKKYVKDGSWQKNYLGEYHNECHDKRPYLILFPFQSDRQKEYRNLSID